MSDNVQVRESVEQRVMKTVKGKKKDKKPENKMTPTEDFGRQRGRGWSGKTKSGESVKVQAEREMNPVTLLGSCSICTPHHYKYAYSLCAG